MSRCIVSPVPKCPCEEAYQGSYPVIAGSDLSHRTPRLLKELRADNVFLFPGMYETVAVVVEVQTTRPDNRRLLTWPCYVTSARAVHGCKAYMLVIATSQAASFGSATVIDIGQPGFPLPAVRRWRPPPLPPSGGLAFGPELMMLNILTGGFKRSTLVARMFALATIAPASRDRRLMYAQLILEYSRKNTKIRQALEELMEDYFKDPFIEGFVEKGLRRARGRPDGRPDGSTGRRADCRPGRAQLHRPRPSTRHD